MLLLDRELKLEHELGYDIALERNLPRPSELGSASGSVTVKQGPYSSSSNAAYCLGFPLALDQPPFALSRTAIEGAIYGRLEFGILGCSVAESLVGSSFLD